MTPEARAAAYALAEHLWRDHNPTRVDVMADVWRDHPRVTVHLVPIPTQVAAMALIQHLEGTVTELASGGRARWVVGTVIRDGHLVQVHVFYMPEPTDQGEESGR